MNDKKNPEFLMKMAFVGIGAFVVLAVIIGSWVWNLMFDPSRFDPVEWANRAIFNGGISLAMMVLGFIAFGEWLKTKETGEYQRTYDDFDSSVGSLYETGRIAFFDQFVPWHAERQLREKKIRHLTNHGVPRMTAEAIVDYAKPEDLAVLSGIRPGDKPTLREGDDVVRTLRDGTEVLIPAIKGVMACYVEDVLMGRIVVAVEDASYYTLASKNTASDLTSLERAQATEKDRVKSLRFSFISKTLAGLVYTAILSLLVVDLNSGAGTAEALWNLVMRLVSATVGFIGGGFAGMTNTKYLTRWLKDKMKVISEFNIYVDRGEFVPKSFAEQAKERIKAAREREQASIDAVVDPTPMITGGNNL